MVLVLCKFLFGIATMKLHNYLASRHHRDTDNNEFLNDLFTKCLLNPLLNFQVLKISRRKLNLKCYLTLVISTTKHVILIHILANCYK